MYYPGDSQQYLQVYKQTHNTWFFMSISWANYSPQSPLLNFIGCKWKQKHLKICSFHDNYYGACTKNNVCLVLEKKSIAGIVEVSLITIANIKVHLLRYSPLHQKINVWAVTTIIKPGSMAADLLLFI